MSRLTTCRVPSGRTRLATYFSLCWRPLAVITAGVLSACTDEGPTSPIVPPAAFAVSEEAGGKPSVDGKIVFAADSIAPDGSRVRLSALFVMNGDGTGIKRITPHLDFARPQWSPDGRRIAFELQGTAPSTPPRIGVMNANGKNVRLLAIGRQPSWSPDGQRLAFHRSAGIENDDLFVIDADGTNEVPIASDPDASESTASWSSDGRVIAYERASAGAFDIFLTSPDGAFHYRVTDCAAANTVCEGPAWSPIPGDSRLAYTAFDLITITSSIHLARLGPEGPVTVASGLPAAGRPAWSPEGSRLVFASRSAPDAPSALLVADVATGALSTLTSGTTDEVDPSWKGGAALTRSVDLLTDAPIGAAGGDRAKPKRLTEGTLDDGPAWSPDYKSIVFTRGSGGSGGNSNIVVMNANGRRQRMIGAGHEPVWSPDGTKIAYWAIVNRLAARRKSS